MLKLGATRDLSELELKRMRRMWREDEVQQATIARIFRISVERLQLVCEDLVRLCPPRSPRASPAMRRRA